MAAAKGGRVFVRAGAGIVKDSVPAGMSIQPGDMVQLLRPVQSAR